MPLLPGLFLFRVACSCPHLKDMPHDQGDDLLDLPDSCRLEHFGAVDGQKTFADVRLAWNESGLGVQVAVRGKQQPPRGDITRPRHSDGVTLWIDTRDSRTSHRANRYCHQFHLLPAGGGTEHDEPAFAQTKIHRAQQDAPLCTPSAVPFRARRLRGGYVVEAFLPAVVLNGFDPEQNSRLGFFYAVHDAELGEQTPGLDADFPFAEDPSLWGVLELIR
jgi:Carbohydrate family 9 binding domain-like